MRHYAYIDVYRSYEKRALRNTSVSIARVGQHHTHYSSFYRTPINRVFLIPGVFIVPDMCTAVVVSLGILPYMVGYILSGSLIVIIGVS